MKNKRTTIIGALIAVAVAVKPILDGSGYHLDPKTCMEMLTAGLIALGSFFAKDAE